MHLQAALKHEPATYCSSHGCRHCLLQQVSEGALRVEVRQAGALRTRSVVDATERHCQWRLSSYG